MVSEFFGLPGEVVRIHTNAVATYQARSKGQEIPFGTRRFQYVVGVYANAVADDGKLVDQGNIDIALGVLDDLRSFGGFYVGSAVYTGIHNNFIGPGDLLEGLCVTTGGHLGDGTYGVLFVTRVDALRGVTHLEIFDEL